MKGISGLFYFFQKVAVVQTCRGKLQLILFFFQQDADVKKTFNCKNNWSDDAHYQEQATAQEVKVQVNIGTYEDRHVKNESEYWEQSILQWYKKRNMYR